MIGVIGFSVVAMKRMACEYEHCERSLSRRALRWAQFVGSKKGSPTNTRWRYPLQKLTSVVIFSYSKALTVLGLSLLQSFRCAPALVNIGLYTT